MLATISQARLDASLPPLADDAWLGGIAQQAAQALAAGSPYPRVAARIEAALKLPSRRLAGVVIVHAETASLSDPLIAAAALVRDHEVIGVGVARGASGRVAKGALSVVLLLARLPP
jgi:hypothetical protein